MSQHSVADDVEPDNQRPASHASSIELPISLSFTSVASNTIHAPTEPPTYNAYNADAEESFLPYLDDDAQAAKAAGIACASLSSRLTPRPLDSPQLAHLSPTPHTQPRSSTPPSDSPRDSPVIDRGAIRSDSPYNSPDLALAIPAAAEQQRNERQSLVAPVAATDRASNRYSKVLHGLGLFGAASKRKSRADMSAPTNPKGLRIETSIAIDDADSASQSTSGLRPQVSRSRSAGTSPLASPALTYKAPTAHHLIGGLAVNHAQGLSSSSSFASHEESKYPTSHNDQFSTGLVPVLNIDDAASSIYSANTPRRPYTPGSFTNGPRTPLTATASPTLGYFDEKKLAGSMGGSSVSLSLSPAGKADSAQEFKMWGDYDAESEPDDYLHEPDADIDKQSSKHMFSPRGMLNIGTLALLGVALLALFGGYPVIAWLSRPKASTKGGFNLGGINATGQVADLHIGRALVDPDTPNNVRTRTTLDGTGRKMNLVFSDEFNRDGRSFYPGDDPFWTAMDLHYWGTDNYEWYDPSAVTTANGSLVITLDQIPTHNLNFRGGMLQSWNQFCFTGGYIEVSMVLPGAPDVAGLWPAAWTMGNLGRAGYGASTDGMWPYTYDACDVGTLPNQTYANGTGPIAAQTTGVYVDKYGPYLSYLPGQRLSRCTCNNSDDHPGPRHADGSWVGRSAPEIDIIEASASHIRGSRGYASMSAQLGPFGAHYNISDAPGSTEFFSDDASLNTYTGSVYQQAASGLVYTKRGAYQETLGEFSSYGYEYKPGSDPDSYILWTLDGNPMWKLNSKALGPDPATEISQRPIPYEPMYILLNLGISASFTTIDWNRLKWPATMLVDYVRVWQVEGEENVGCDPENAPTAAYIEKHKEAYYNANLTTWTETRERGGYNQKFPGNSMLGQC